MNSVVLFKGWWEICVSFKSAFHCMLVLYSWMFTPNDFAEGAF